MVKVAGWSYFCPSAQLCGSLGDGDVAWEQHLAPFNAEKCALKAWVCHSGPPFAYTESWWPQFGAAKTITAVNTPA